MIASAAESRTADELAGDDALLERRAAPGHREPAGKAADGEPGREPDQCEPVPVDDEEEVERPARGGDREATPDSAHRAGERGDDEPRCDGHARIVVVPVSGQHDQRLEQDTEDDGD